jgi:hypothetical protein
MKKFVHEISYTAEAAKCDDFGTDPETLMTLTVVTLSDFHFSIPRYFLVHRTF